MSDKKLIDLLINKEDTIEYEMKNNKRKDFCPLRFLKNDEDNNKDINNNLEENNNE